MSDLVPDRPSGVSDGTRTRDIRDHNAALYQLSYTHHVGVRGRRAGSVYLSLRDS
jgi:hypothetical protein